MNTLNDAFDPDTLEAIANEIDCHEHSARAHSLRLMAAKQRLAMNCFGALQTSCLHLITLLNCDPTKYLLLNADGYQVCHGTTALVVKQAVSILIKQGDLKPQEFTLVKPDGTRELLTITE